jgi:hypothetical protein
MASQPSSETSLVSPILRNEHGPAQDVFTCSLCCEIPMEPVVTPCHHVFCRPCIVRALQVKEECPSDRQPLELRELQDINGALRRIWENIPVRCPINQCSWTGTMGNYEAHAGLCMKLSFGGDQEYERHVRELKEKYEEQLQQLSRKFTTVKEELRALKEELRENQCEVCKPLDYDYQYDRFRVVELTQLICRNLEDMPDSVDRNRIYNCIRHCHNDFERAWDDNPDHYLLDVRMLLNVCRASNWFTDRQQENITKWCAHPEFQDE